MYYLISFIIQIQVKNKINNILIYEIDIKNNIPHQHIKMIIVTKHINTCFIPYVEQVLAFSSV